jgi:hypothetical protein
MESKTLKYYAEYRAKNRLKLREYNKNYNKQYRDEHGYSNERKWDKNNPEKRRAHAIVQAAISSGEIKKPKGDKVAHHSDYSNPKDIKWVSKSKNRNLSK